MRYIVRDESDDEILKDPSGPMFLQKFESNWNFDFYIICILNHACMYARLKLKLIFIIIYVCIHIYRLYCIYAYKAIQRTHKAYKSQKESTKIFC